MAYENQETNRSATQNIRELAESSKQLFAAGEKLTENLTELEQKVEHATDLSYQISSRPWLVPVVAVAGGVLGWWVFSGRR